jgi:hypothetical protein
VKARDENGATTRFCIHANLGPSDNSMQSEISAHIGGRVTVFAANATHDQSLCKAGGTQQEKQQMKVTMHCLRYLNQHAARASCF